jgi:HAE1 family hydrophobic/amphiphilic exporter-1
MDQISEFCVRRPITTIMAFVMIIVLGAVSYFQLPVQLLPDITLPTIGIFAQRDASAEDNLEKITRPVEALVSELPRVRRVRSWTRPDRIWIQAEFDFGTDMRLSNVDINDRLVAFRTDLKDRRVFISAFPFSTDNFQASYMFLSVLGDGDPGTLFDTAQDRIVDQLSAIDGVARVEVQGSTADAAEVEIDTNLLANYGLEFGNVISRISSAASDDSYLGRLRDTGETSFVRLNDQVRTVGELAEVYVDNEGNVRLSDVAKIYVGKAIESSVYRAEGKNAIGIEMQRENGVNMISLARKTRERVEEINKTLPPGVKLSVDEDLAKYVEDALSGVARAALFGALLSLVVPLIFFRSLKLALIVFAAVPICLVAVFNLFLATGMSLNIFSIVGLAIGVGMVVDNSIVVCENCFRLIGAGHLDPKQAAIRGAGEVAKALFASTATTAIVFLPILFIEDEFRLFVKEPTLALVFPLILSFLVAVTLCPVLVYAVMKNSKNLVLHKGSARTREVYRLMLKWGIRHRGKVILILGAVMFFTVFQSFVEVTQETTSQDAEDDFIRVFLQIPRGTLLSEVNRSVSVVEARLSTMPDVDKFSVSFNSSEGARFNIRLKERPDRPSKRSSREIEQTIIEEIGDVPQGELSMQRNDTPVVAASLTQGERGTLEIRGYDSTVLDPYAARLIDTLRSHPDIINVKIEEEANDPQILVQMDRERARLFGVTAQTIGEYVSSTRASGTLSSLRLVDGEKRTDVSITIKDFDGSTASEAKALPVFTQTAGIAKLGDLTSFRASRTETRIQRNNRQSNMEISYFTRPGVDKQALADDVKRFLRTLPNPAGIDGEVTGQSQKIDERVQNMQMMAFSGTILVYMVMAAVFESFWVPFVIVLMVALVPLGTKFALGLAGLPLDDLAVFGFVLLIGLVVNSGIVMMDRALELQRSYGFGRTRAVFTAADTRLRPILMTYLTTVLGLLPMAVLGDETSQWRPVAVAIIGGLTSSTVVTLLALPSFYLIGDDFVSWARPPFLRALGLFFHGVEVTFNFITERIVALVAIWEWSPRTWPGRFIRKARTVLRFLFITTPRAIWRAVRFVGRTIAAAARAVSGDAALVARLAFLRPKPEVAAGEAPLASTHSLTATDAEAEIVTPIQLENIQVVYATAATSWQRFIPTKGYAIGKRPAVGLHALRGVTSEIGTGLHGLLGPNGAGKTTLLRCVAGLIEPTRGTVRLFGAAHRDSAAQLAPLIGYLPQNHGHYESMTLYEYLDLFATLTSNTVAKARALHGAQGGELASRLAALTSLDSADGRHRAISRAIEEVNLLEFAHERIGGFSGGMKQRAGIARVLLQAPPILIVDEPTAGLDPVERVKVRLLLSQLAAERTVIFSTHIVEDLEQTCRSIGILLQGRMVYSGTPSELRERLEGRVWEVLSEDGSDPEQLRQDAIRRGARVLFQIVRSGREGFRLLVPGDIAMDRAQRVTPTLEDALLATLNDSRLSAGT